MPIHRATALALLCALPLFTACSNLKPVATFGAGASALGTSYRPFVANMVTLCKKSRTLETITHTGAYSYKDLHDKSEANCKELSDQKDTALEFATVVEGYGAVLVELSGLKADALTADIGNLADTAGKLKTKSGDTIFNTNALSAASKLASGIVELFLSHKITKVTKQTLADAHDPLTTTVGAMKTFVTRIYPGLLTEYENSNKLLETYVVSQSTIEDVPNNGPAVAANRSKALPYRLLQPEIRQRLVEVAADRERIEKFGQASDALIAAHKELIDRFDEKTEPDKLALLKDFIKKARALRDAIEKI